MPEYFFLLCVVLRRTQRSGAARRDLLLALPREPRRCGTSCSASRPQGRLQNSSGCPVETFCFQAKCLFLQQSESFIPETIVPASPAHKSTETGKRKQTLLLLLRC